MTTFLFVDRICKSKIYNTRLCILLLVECHLNWERASLVATIVTYFFWIGGFCSVDDAYFYDYFPAITSCT